MGAPVRFKEADLKRAVRGVVGAGVRVGQIIIDPNGRIVITPVGQVPEKANDSSWDDV